MDVTTKPLTAHQGAILDYIRQKKGHAPDTRSHPWPIERLPW